MNFPKAFLTISQSILRSTALLTLLWLIVFDRALTSLAPLETLDGTEFSYLSQHYVTAKLTSYFRSNRKAEIVMLGSSLFLFPSTRCAEEKSPTQPNRDPNYIRNTIFRNASCDYLEKKVSQTLGKNIDVQNLAVAGALISDQYFILQKCLDIGKKPEVIVCEISPRAFIDNTMPEPNGTPVAQTVDADLSENTTDSFSFQQKNNCAKFLEANLRNYWPFYKERLFYKEYITNTTIGLSGRTLAQFETQKNFLQAAFHENAEEEVRKSKDAKDLAYYHVAYSPINHKLEEIEFSYLKKLLDESRKNGVKVILVRVPLAARNSALLPAHYQEQWLERIIETAKPYDAIVLDAAKHETFAATDFEDTIHLGRSGGEKLFNLLAAVIGKQLGRN